MARKLKLRKNMGKQSMSKFLCGMVLTGLSVAATAGQTEMQEKSFDSMRELLTKCAYISQLESELLQARYETKVELRKIENIERGAGNWISESDRSNIMQKVVSDSSVKDSEHQKCVGDAKIEMNKNARTFLRYFKPSQQQKAKDALARWLTALGASGKRNFGTELAKFDGAVDDLKVDAMTSQK